MVRFALRRKTGYISPYSLAMIYPSWEASVYYGNLYESHIAPMMISFRKDEWKIVNPALIRFASWLARKLLNRDRRGQWKTSPELPMPWKRPRAKRGKVYALFITIIILLGLAAQITSEVHA